MSATIHLPAELLIAADRRAPERAIATETEWSAGFVDELAAARADVDGCRVLEEVRVSVASSRTRKELLSFA